jgi:hypothetical protein
MAARGQFKPPVAPLSKALNRAMEAIDSDENGVAIFLVAGEVLSTKRRSEAFENNVVRLGNNLVGVYDLGADPRRVREDLAEFYKGSA